MKFRLIHRSKNRFRIGFPKRRLTDREADLLYYFFLNREEITRVQVFARHAEMAVCYRGGSDTERSLVHLLRSLELTDPDLQELVPAVSARATNEEFKEKIISMTLSKLIRSWFLPVPIRTAVTLYHAVPFLWHGIQDLIHKKFSAEIIHASAIAAALVTGEYETASSIAFLTELGELLEEWTYKKSVDDLAQSLALNVAKVWKVEGEAEELVPIGQIRTGDCIRVTMGNMIPLDGVVAEGEAMVNQAALTGEPLAVRKRRDITVFAGTVLEEGELVIQVRQISGETRYDKIVKMIQQSEAMAALTQTRAEKAADRLVPYTFGAAALAFLLTGNLMKSASVLMADFSCAVEVAMPISVLSAMREAGKHRITVKGGAFLEKIAAADTIVFDKTGTLTKATPRVDCVVPMGGRDRDEMLRIAACLEEHFPHSLANAVVAAAREEGLDHEEMHSKAEYIVARGIASTIDGERVIIGSEHFIFDDEQVSCSEADRQLLADLPDTNTYLYLAIRGQLAAVIGIRDPIKEEAPAMVEALRRLGIRHIVMMTGDGERTASAIARASGISEYRSEVLPEDKAAFIRKEKEAGRTVVMVGDGINDSLALSEADVGIAIQEGADIAQEIADITLPGSDLNQLAEFKKISDLLMKRMRTTYTFGNLFNGGILLLGLMGIVSPGTAAILHNTSTIGLCLRNMNDLVSGD